MVKNVGEAEVILVDFDGTLTIEQDGDICIKNERMVEQVEQWLEEGKIVKLYTARKGADLVEAQQYLLVWGIPLPYAGEKPAADLYVDDKAVRPEELI